MPPLPSSENAEILPARRELPLCGALALTLAAVMFAFKLRAYLGLVYTSDLFQFAQLATTWLDGRFLWDNCYGDHLASHTYYFVPLLALFVVPFGVPGLLLALSLAWGAGYFALVRVMRVLSVPLIPALAMAGLLSVMPLTIHVYQDSLYGFHPDLLLPAFGAWLAYFLLQKNGWGAIPVAAAMIAVKEDAPIATAAIAGAVLSENLLMGLVPRRSDLRALGRAIWSKVNWPAIAVIMLAAVSLPLLVWVLGQHKPVGIHAVGSFQRLYTVDRSEVSDPLSLLGYFLDNFGAWLGSAKVLEWLPLALIATFGFVVPRPHLLVIGIVTSVTAWLMQDDLLWASRFASSLAFMMVAAALGFAAAYRRWRTWSTASGWRRALGFLVLALLVVFGWQTQLAKVPAAAEFYRLQPTLPMTAEDLQAANRLFGLYRDQRRPGDPVTASAALFRYADYRNLYWMGRLDGHPKPVWVLYAFETPPARAAYGDYELVGQAGRFALFRSNPPASPTSQP